MLATVTTVKSPLNPMSHRMVEQVRRRRRISTLAPKTTLPVICFHNGQPILRADWNRQIADGDSVVFITLLQGGGGGSNPLKIVMMVAVAVVAPQIAGPLASSMGIAEGTLSFHLLSGAISKCGKLLTNLERKPNEYL